MYCDLLVMNASHAIVHVLPIHELDGPRCSAALADPAIGVPGVLGEGLFEIARAKSARTRRRRRRRHGNKLLTATSEARHDRSHSTNVSLSGRFWEIYSDRDVPYRRDLEIIGYIQYITMEPHDMVLEESMLEESNLLSERDRTPILLYSYTRAISVCFLSTCPHSLLVCSFLHEQLSMC